MLHQEQNQYGVISIDNAFLNQIIKDSIKPFGDKVHIANYKRDSQVLYIKLGRYDMLYQIDTHESDKGVYVKVYLLLKFGTSISSVVNSIMKNLSDIILNDLELSIDNLEVLITGLELKNSIIKKDLIYSYFDEDGKKNY